MVQPRHLLVGAAAAASALTLLPAPAAQARTRAPYLERVRCVPVKASACRHGVRVKVGRQVQLKGHRLKAGMRVTFRWSRGALATKLHHSRAGWTARVPAGTSAGRVDVTVTDRGHRRSNRKRISVLAQPAPASSPATSGLPAAFRGHGMWIWYVAKSEGGDVAKIVARAQAAGMSTVFVKGADGGSVWPQLTPSLVASLKAGGLKVCAWQFVYGKDPAAEAQAAIATLGTGVDCFVIDAETAYEGRYASAQRYMAALREAAGPAFPIGLTSFPYVDYHPGLPYSVFFGPGGAQANLPQVYWKDIGDTVDAASAHTFAHNRIYQAALAPLGQTYGKVSDADLQRFRQVWASYGAGGLSWWDWQETSDDQWATLAAPAPAPVTLADPGWPALGKGAKGDEVVWLQEHLVSADPSVQVDGRLDSDGVAALKNFQLSRGLPPTGVTDAATWQAALALPLTAKDWTAASSSRSARAASAGGSRRPSRSRDRAPASAHARSRHEIPQHGRG